MEAANAGIEEILGDHFSDWYTEKPAEKPHKDPMLEALSQGPPAGYTPGQGPPADEEEASSGGFGVENEEGIMEAADVEVGFRHAAMHDPPALRPLGVRDLKMPLTSLSVWTAIRAARRDAG